jgi:hypothetical protein
MIARLILLAFGATVFFVAVRRLRAYRLKERYTLLFLLAGLPFLVLAAWPRGVGWVATKLQIDYRTVPVLCLAALLILMVVELLTIVSLQDRRIATLAQIVGILMEKQGMSDRDASPAEIAVEKSEL